MEIANFEIYRDILAKSAHFDELDHDVFQDGCHDLPVILTGRTYVSQRDDPR